MCPTSWHVKKGGRIATEVLGSNSGAGDRFFVLRRQNKATSNTKSLAYERKNPLSRINISISRCMPGRGPGSLRMGCWTSSHLWTRPWVWPNSWSRCRGSRSTGCKFSAQVSLNWLEPHSSQCHPLQWALSHQASNKRYLMPLGLPLTPLR